MVESQNVALELHLKELRAVSGTPSSNLQPEMQSGGHQEQSMQREQEERQMQQQQQMNQRDQRDQQQRQMQQRDQQNREQHQREEEKREQQQTEQQQRQMQQSQMQQQREQQEKQQQREIQQQMEQQQQREHQERQTLEQEKQQQQRQMQQLTQQQQADSQQRQHRAGVELTKGAKPSSCTGCFFIGSGFVDNNESDRICDPLCEEDLNPHSSTLASSTVHVLPEEETAKCNLNSGGFANGMNQQFEKHPLISWKRTLMDHTQNKISTVSTELLAASETETSGHSEDWLESWKEEMLGGADRCTEGSIECDDGDREVVEEVVVEEPNGLNSWREILLGNTAETPSGGETAEGGMYSAAPAVVQSGSAVQMRQTAAISAQKGALAHINQILTGSSRVTLDANVNSIEQLKGISDVADSPEPASTTDAASIDSWKQILRGGAGESSITDSSPELKSDTWGFPVTHTRSASLSAPEDSNHSAQFRADETQQSAREIFESINANRDGVIDREEMENAAEQGLVTARKIQSQSLKYVSQQLLCDKDQENIDPYWMVRESPGGTTGALDHKQYDLTNRVAAGVPDSSGMSVAMVGSMHTASDTVNRGNGREEYPYAAVYHEQPGVSLFNSASLRQAERLGEAMYAAEGSATSPTAKHTLGFHQAGMADHQVTDQHDLHRQQSCSFSLTF